MKTEMKFKFSKTVGMFGVLLVFLILSCKRSEEYPVPGPYGLNYNAPVVITKYVTFNFNNDGKALVNPSLASGIGIYADNNNEVDLTKSGIFLSPTKTAPDSAFRMYGKDLNANYYIGGFYTTDVPTFNIPNLPPTKVWMNFDIYCPLSTGNFQISFVEKDKDVFSWNPPGFASPPQNVWTTYSPLISDFVIDTTQSTGNRKIDNLSTIGKIQFTLLSGGGAGKTDEIYLDNIIFTTGGPIK